VPLPCGEKSRGGRCHEWRRVKGPRNTSYGSKKLEGKTSPDGPTDQAIIRRTKRLANLAHAWGDCLKLRWPLCCYTVNGGKKKMRRVGHCVKKGAGGSRRSHAHRCGQGRTRTLKYKARRGSTGDATLPMMGQNKHTSQTCQARCDSERLRNLQPEAPKTTGHLWLRGLFRLGRAHPPKKPSAHF
jgi:hypothetical protein